MSVHSRWASQVSIPGLKSLQMADEVLVFCPYCGEELEIYVEPDVTGTFIQDCEVCCNPWRVRVSGTGDDRVVSVSRGDGSE